VAKPFTSKTDLGQMDENSSKIIAFSKQLQDENITDTERAVIEKQINKLTTKFCNCSKYYR
jgi:predicted RNA binding protein with dsRBD fold (UPF0201 family)